MKRVLITGANTGIGRATALALVRSGCEVWMLNRSQRKSMPALEEIAAMGGKARYYALDLADLASVRACAARIAQDTDHIDVLVNNAGVAGHPGVTAQGLEVTVGVSHVGHFLLTRELLPLLRASEHGPARIVNVASGSHLNLRRAPSWDVVEKPTRTPWGIWEYFVAKLANVLFTRELARRLPAERVHAYAVHPGRVASDIWRKVPQPFRGLILRTMLTNEQGAMTSVHCAIADACREDNGLYYADSAPARANPLTDDAALARDLWERTERWIAERAPGPSAGWAANQALSR